LRPLISTAASWIGSAGSNLARFLRDSPQVPASSIIFLLLTTNSVFLLDCTVDYFVCVCCCLQLATPYNHCILRRNCNDFLVFSTLYEYAIITYTISFSVQTPSIPQTFILTTVSYSSESDLSYLSVLFVLQCNIRLLCCHHMSSACRLSVRDI